MDFHITEYEKFIDTVSDSTLQLTIKGSTICQVLMPQYLRKYPELFEKAIKIFLLNFLCIRQPQVVHHNTMQKQMEESICLLLSQILK
jgi:hypothetical protein